MISIDLMSRIPVYEQIIEQIENYVLAGILSSGDKIPSVRSLSVKLSINPNTIQKAYSELDRHGILSSVPGKGSFISENALNILKANSRDKLEQLNEFLEKLILAGITREEIIKCVDTVFDNAAEL